MASIDALKERIDLKDLADWLGMEKPDKSDKGNWLATWRNEKNASVSIFDDGKGWYDHAESVGGSCIDLVMKVRGIDVGDAIKALHDFTGLPMDEPEKKDPFRKKSKAEYIAERCLEKISPVRQWLVQERKLDEKAVDAAIKAKTLGMNTWVSPSTPEGNVGHGGDAAAFIVRDLQGMVAAVEMRFLDPESNGGVKNQCQGDKSAHFWTANHRRIKKAHTVYIVESPINALSIDSVNMPAGTVAIATLGKANIEKTDWHFLNGKKVVLCMDNDQKPDSRGLLPGPSSAWRLYEILTGYNIAVHIVDQQTWEHNDVNDLLQAGEGASLRGILQKFEPWIIPGLWANDMREGKPRLYLPIHDMSQYYKFRNREDFTALVKSQSEDDDGNTKMDIVDLCGFRVASLTRVTIAGSTSVMSGDQDNQPTTLFSISVQVPRHGNRLIRRVFDDERLHNVDQWKKFGPVFNVSSFSRMINILERSAHLGERRAANFVGLCWRDGKAIVNEGQDCYFKEPEKQCPYHNLVFPTGTKYDAKKIIEAYQVTFGKNAALLMMTWALGGHLKAHLGFWPHMMLQADKGSGKSVLTGRLARTLAFTMFSGQSLQTEFRMLTSISHTSHPVGWEEISARKQDVIDKAVSMLQESYQYTTTRRGSDMTEFLLSAPVLLAGEDVPVKSLTGKLVRVELREKGPMLPDDLPVFPVRQWLEYLASIPSVQIKETYHKAHAWALKHCSADKKDSGASRMVTNYAAMATAWRLLSDFAGVDVEQGKLLHDLLATMNGHINETSSDREPWVWILEAIFDEIDTGNFHQVLFRNVSLDDGLIEECMCIKSSTIMQHFSKEMRLREKWNALPVKSERVLKRQLKLAGVCVKDEVALTINGSRVRGLMALSLTKMEEYGLLPSVPDKFYESNKQGDMV